MVNALFFSRRERKEGGIPRPYICTCRQTRPVRKREFRHPRDIQHVQHPQHHLTLHHCSGNKRTLKRTFQKRNSPPFLNFNHTRSITTHLCHSLIYPNSLSQSLNPSKMKGIALFVTAIAAICVITPSTVTGQELVKPLEFHWSIAGNGFMVCQRKHTLSTLGRALVRSLSPSSSLGFHATTESLTLH